MDDNGKNDQDELIHNLSMFTLTKIYAKLQTTHFLRWDGLVTYDNHMIISVACNLSLCLYSLSYS